MTASQKLQIRLSEIRTRLNQLGSKDGDLSEEERGEVDKLTGEYQDAEARHRAAIVTESEEAEQRQAGEEPGGETGEGAEMRRLMERATIGNYVEAALQGTIETGAERELADALEVRRGPGYVDGVRDPLGDAVAGRAESIDHQHAERWAGSAGSDHRPPVPAA